MLWAICLKDTVTGKVRVVDDEDEFVGSSLIERHVVPFTEVGDEMRFGIHDFTRNCICRPRIEYENGNEVILHEDRKPN